MVTSNWEFLQRYFLALYGYHDFFHSWELVSSSGKETIFFAALRLRPAAEIMAEVKSIVIPAATQFILACASVMVVKKVLGL
jgi:serine kinase of HPr protein (carbohydrate metabolism regulator)